MAHDKSREDRGQGRRESTVPRGTSREPVQSLPRPAREDGSEYPATSDDGSPPLVRQDPLADLALGIVSVNSGSRTCLPAGPVFSAAPRRVLSEHHGKRWGLRLVLGEHPTILRYGHRYTIPCTVRTDLM